MSEREVISAEDFEALVIDEMCNDINAGGDPETSRAYAERWAHSEYRIATESSPAGRQA
jgi:hypothetical protein